MVEKTFNLIDMIMRIYNKIVPIFTDLTDFLFTNLGTLIIENNFLPPWFVQLLINLGAINEMWLHYSLFELVLGTGIVLVLSIHAFKFIKGAFF